MSFERPSSLTPYALPPRVRNCIREAEKAYTNNLQVAKTQGKRAHARESAVQLIRAKQFEIFFQEFCYSMGLPYDPKAPMHLDPEKIKHANFYIDRFEKAGVSTRLFSALTNGRRARQHRGAQVALEAEELLRNRLFNFFRCRRDEISLDDFFEEQMWVSYPNPARPTRPLEAPYPHILKDVNDFKVLLDVWLPLALHPMPDEEIQLYRQFDVPEVMVAMDRAFTLSHYRTDSKDYTNQVATQPQFLEHGRLYHSRPIRQGRAR